MTSDDLDASYDSAEPAELLYQRRAQQCAVEVERYGRHNGKLIAARGLTFLAGGGCVLMALLDADARPFWIALATGWLVTFLACAIVDEWFQRQRAYFDKLRQVNLWQLARKQRRFQDVPVPQVTVPREHEAVAKDLDLFGRASLFQLVCLATTPRGRNLLRDWLLQPATPEEIVQRQDAVQVLVPEVELREQLVLRGHLLSAGLAGPEAFEDWVESVPLLQRHRWLNWLTRLLPLLGVAAFAALAAGWLSANAAVALLIAILVANVLVSVFFTGSVHDIFDNISTRSGELRHYLALFELITSVPPGSTRLEQIRQQAVREEHGALTQLARLNRIMRFAALRHDPLLSIFYFVLQGTVLWDFHVLWLLERWQRRCRHLVRHWFDALAELEALLSWACLAHDHPDWCFPELERDGTPRIQAAGLGHPLLPDATRVVNDVDVGPAGTVLLVTGSNMSGKSTLLRSIGLNAMLAEAGSPVCARRLQLPPLTVATSMRIQDSLQDGVSFFMAELQRLKSIVDLASRYQQRPDRTLLFLLDEVLQGTNSVERHLAVARVLAHLVAKGAIGAASTHDLELARSPQLVHCCRAVHFRETLHCEGDRQRMTFDYRLREGIATTSNAIKLLEMVGLTEA